MNPFDEDEIWTTLLGFVTGYHLTEEEEEILYAEFNAREKGKQTLGAYLEHMKARILTLRTGLSDAK